MKTLAALCILCLTLAPVQAEQTVDPQADVEKGFSLLEEGTRLLLRGLVDQVEPELRGMMEEVEPQMRGFLDQIEPALRDLAAKMGDMSNYHAPEILPNGDIIIRRKVPTVPVVPDGSEIEL